MKKQEAIDFIREGLATGRTIKQISADLSARMGAPKDVVEKFVSKTANELVAVDFLTSESIPIEAKPAPVTLPDMETLASLAEQSPPAAPKAKTLAPEQPSPASGEIQAQKPPVESPEESPKPAPLHEDFVPAPKYSQAELEKFILRELGRQRKQSDVVVRLCEATGMHWNQAQRLVARVAARNQKRLNTSQNLIIIPVSLIALIAGAVLLFADVSEALVLQQLLASPEAVDPQKLEALYGSSQQLIWGFLTGGALAVGGLVGLILAIKKQLE